jgi:D-alanine-D-alanine ligase
MKLTLLFGGESRERLVSVATAQSIYETMSSLDLWFWSDNGQVYQVAPDELMRHERPFERPFEPIGNSLGTLEAALDRAVSQPRFFVLGLHGGMAENGVLQALCEARGIGFTGTGSLGSHLSFDKRASKTWLKAAGIMSPPTIALEDIEDALSLYGTLFAKPAQDGSSFGLIKVSGKNDLAAVRKAAQKSDYLIEACIDGIEGTCGVIEKEGVPIALPPVEIIPAEGSFDYEAKYLSKMTQEICPGRFDEASTKAISDMAIRAHLILGCAAYSRTDFILNPKGLYYIETNTLPGLTRSSLLPKSLKAAGIEFSTFLDDLIVEGQGRARARARFAPRGA